MTANEGERRAARLQLWELLRWGWLGILAAALSTPWVYRVGPQLGALLGRDGLEFRRLFDRLFMIWLGLGLVSLWRRHGMPPAREIGWRFPRGWAREIALAAGVAAGSVALVQAANLLLGWRAPDPELTGAGLLRLVGVGLLSGAAVALIEELFFRGWLQRLLMAAWGVAPAITLGAALYSLPHFLRGPLVPAEMSGFEWDAGLRALPSCARSFAPERGLWFSMVGLWVVGVVLGALRERTGRLTWAMGLHAGWVAALRISGEATEQVDRAWQWLGGGQRMVDGVAGLLVLLLCWWLTTRLAESRLAREGAGAG